MSGDGAACWTTWHGLWPGRRDGHYGGFEGVEGDAGVAADGGREGFDGVVGHVDVEVAEAAGRIGEGATDEGFEAGFVEGLEGEDTAAGEQWADDFKAGVFGGGADQGDGAVLDIRKDGVLLGFVEAVDFVDEKDRAAGGSVSTAG